MPVQYPSGIVEEHKITRSEAGLFDVSHMGQLSIEGRVDLILTLEKVIPTDLKNIKLNQSKYSFLTNEDGGIYDDLIVTKVKKGFSIILNAACKNNDFKIINTALGNKFSYKGKDIYITRSGYTGEDGFEISIPNKLVEDFGPCKAIKDKSSCSVNLNLPPKAFLIIL